MNNLPTLSFTVLCGACFRPFAPLKPLVSGNTGASFSGVILSCSDFLCVACFENLKRTSLNQIESLDHCPACGKADVKYCPLLKDSLPAEIRNRVRDPAEALADADTTIKFQIDTYNKTIKRFWLHQDQTAKKLDAANRKIREYEEILARLGATPQSPTPTSQSSSAQSTNNCVGRKRMSSDLSSREILRTPQQIGLSSSSNSSSGDPSRGISPNPTSATGFQRLMERLNSPGTVRSPGDSRLSAPVRSSTPTAQEPNYSAYFQQSAVRDWQQAKQIPQVRPSTTPVPSSYVRSPHIPIPHFSASRGPRSFEDATGLRGGLSTMNGGGKSVAVSQYDWQMERFQKQH